MKKYKCQRCSQKFIDGFIDGFLIMNNSCISFEESKKISKFWYNLLCVDCYDYIDYILFERIEADEFIVISKFLNKCLKK